MPEDHTLESIIVTPYPSPIHTHHHRHHRCLYCRMLVADRDTSMLCLFEAINKAAPQLLVQVCMFVQLITLHEYYVILCLV
jgi:hypothetical protein